MKDLTDTTLEVYGLAEASEDAPSRDDRSDYLRLLLGDAGCLKVDFNRMAHGAVLFMPTGDKGKGVMIATLPDGFGVSKRDAERLLLKFVDRGTMEAFTPREVLRLL